MAESAFSHHASPETFEAVVIQKSYECPVLVDFWADWCQPCQMLMPVLAKLVDEYAGAFQLVKVNTDEHQELAMQYQVRSLPTVKIFRNGEVVDEFMGVQPEPVIRELIDKHRVRQGAGQLDEAFQHLQSGAYEQAEQIARDIIAVDPDYTDGFVIFLQSLLGQQKFELAEQQLAALPEDMQTDERIQLIAREVKLGKVKSQSGNLDELRVAWQNNPNDPEKSLQLATACVAHGQQEEGLELMLDTMKKHPGHGDGAARQALLEAFEVLGNDDPLVKRYRGRLFALMH